MAEVIRMPRLSDTMEEGTLVKWLKKVGDPIEKGDILGEIETDKATMEWENFHLSGVLLYVGVKEGDAVPVDTILGVIGKAGENFQTAIDAANGTSAINGTPATNGVAAAAPSVAAPVAAPVAVAAAVAVPVEAPILEKIPVADSRIKASPLAKSVAAQAGLDLSTVQGTGEQGRIVRRDVDALVGNGAVPPVAVPTAVVAAPVIAGRSEERRVGKEC